MPISLSLPSHSFRLCIIKIITQVLQSIQYIPTNIINNTIVDIRNRILFRISHIIPYLIQLYDAFQGLLELCFCNHFIFAKAFKLAFEQFFDTNIIKNIKINIIASEDSNKPIDDINILKQIYIPTLIELLVQQIDL